MDFRARLLVSLAIVLAVLMVLAAGTQVVSLRGDIETEFQASAQLMRTLQVLIQPVDDATSTAAPPAWDAANLRHVSLRATPGLDSEPRHPLLAWLGLTPPPGSAQTLNVGGRTIYMVANADSEIAERWSTTLKTMATLGVFAVITLVMVAWASQRALAPVRALEAGLSALSRGEPLPPLPQFAWREFQRLGEALQGLALALNTAEAAQHDLTRRLISVQEQERRALARELHDELGQTLTGLHWTLAHLARQIAQGTMAGVEGYVEELRQDLSLSRTQLRGLLGPLRPYGLDGQGLPAMLRELLASWQRRLPSCQLQLACPEDLSALNEAQALTCYRVVQEALTNLARHSQAQHAGVTLHDSDQAYTLTVWDDGVGLATPASERGRGGMPRGTGLLGMRERVEMLGGSLTITSPGRWPGTSPTGPASGLMLTAILPHDPTSHERKAT